MIRMCTSMMIVRLLICTVILVPPYCRGFKNRHIQHLYEKGLVINSENWYLQLNISEVNEEIKKVTKRIQSRYRLEDEILSYFSPLKLGSPVHGQLIDSMPSDEGRSGSRTAEIIIDVTRSLKNTYCLKHRLSDIQCARDLTKVSLNGTILGEMCMSEYYDKNPCIGNDFKYRSANGSCNNLKRKYLGKANTPYKRLLFPIYSDGVNEMPNIYENNLPNPRSLSTYFVKDENLTDHTKTMMMAYWAMFIGHDLSHTAVSTMGTENRFVSCCDDDKSFQYTMNKNIGSCKPIRIPDDDKFFNPKPNDCINYVRSRPAVRSDCTFGPMEQMNQATHYLDASMIYGTTEKRTLLLRSKSCGMMKEPDRYSIASTLPLESTDTHACQNGNGTCYKAGDIRANAYLPLTALHILWLREHNRVAVNLCAAKPEWTDEQLFREAKKIVIASIQHITYNEWLPALLGVNYTKKSGLGLEKRTTYDETADPTVSNSFATAILPFYNSMISNYVGLYYVDIFGRLFDTGGSHYLLRKYYNQPIAHNIRFNDILKGLVSENTQKVDMMFTQTITNYLYSIDPNNSFGMDAFSLDIQRSRDHGIPSYTQFRKYCGLKDIQNVQHLSKIMVEGSAERLLKQYKNWNAIDLLVGVLLEKHVDNAMVGPTMRCIIREQFIRTRIADRHFYDIPGVFSEYQLEDIKQVSLARILCDNAKAHKMQLHAFFKLASDEEHLLCNETSIPETNYGSWFDDF